MKWFKLPEISKNIQLTKQKVLDITIINKYNKRFDEIGAIIKEEY